MIKCSNYTQKKTSVIKLTQGMETNKITLGEKNYSNCQNINHKRLGSNVVSYYKM